MKVFLWLILMVATVFTAHASKPINTASVAFTANQAHPLDFSHPFESATELANANSLHWVRRGTGPVAVIAIHGTPGNWRAWQALMDAQGSAERYSIYAIDRPGWGGSSLPNGRVIADFNQQQALIHRWYVQHVAPSHQKVLVVGHSWGATVAAALIANNPNDYAGALLIAGPFHPALSRPRWYHRWAKSSFIQKLIGPNMSKSNLEMLPLSQSLKQLESIWPKVKTPLIILQGKKDWLVDDKNAQYLFSQLSDDIQKKLVLRRDLGHFFVFSKPEIIRQYLDELTDGVPR